MRKGGGKNDTPKGILGRKGTCLGYSGLEHVRKRDLCERNGCKGRSNRQRGNRVIKKMKGKVLVIDRPRCRGRD